MKNHPLIESFHRFYKLQHHLDIWQCEYHFDLGQKMMDALQNVPLETSVFINIQSNGEISLDVLSGPCNGCRVNAGPYYLYLPISESDIKGPTFLDTLTEVHSILMGGGIYYPKKEDLLNYWEHPEDTQNSAESYVLPVGRSVYLEHLIKSHCGHISSALELGCNIGRNLNHLKQSYNIPVAGIEISQHALDLMRKTYPNLKDESLYPGDMAEVIKSIPDKSYDLVFSMAVLMHIHITIPLEFWSRIVRIASRYIITIENETGGSNRNWPRNYKELFEPLGAKEIFSEVGGCTDGDLETYTARVFSV